MRSIATFKKAGLINNLSGELMTWHREHEAQDEKRMKEKAQHEEELTLRRKALTKLSSEEIKALGLTK